MKITKAIIPVAGMGTRFLPATKAVPKEMLPIVDKPSIQYIVEEAVNSGIEEILFVTSSYKNAVQDHFDRNYELENRLLQSNKTEQIKMIKDIASLVKCYYIRQGEPLGTAHAIRLCKNFIGNEPFAVLYGDDLVLSDEPCLKQMIDMHYEKDANILCAVSVSDDIIPSKGIIKYKNDNQEVDRLIEKPLLKEAPSNHATIGRYILKPEIFDEIDKLTLKNGEYLLTDAMGLLMNKQKFYACSLTGEYHDIGNQIGYIKANVEFALKREDIKQELKEYLKNKTEKI